MCGTIVRYLDDEDDNVLGTATEEPMVCGAVNWHADVQVTTTTHSRSVNFRTDTGADVAVVPDRFFNKKSPLIQKTDKKLFGPGQSKIIVLGKVRATMAVGEVSTDQDLYVVADLKEPLLGRPINSSKLVFYAQSTGVVISGRLGRPATEALKLIERVNAADNDQYRK